ncbi:hypothetical protein BDV32DRAFT_143728 [Aspergillus pseudonomiae]|uniref:Amine oxidase n=1 Tax=Aspergillus pseudonomiae TaxID=1506151 RepID=A0A5N6IJD4_9EURO|nr:uncharacterized protein BDV37DRAFT_278373 [Aspergillus pseudonomiae]KAB8265990.1 hypothetical protein BDV32DRAFT_143728 [Aspergillus pseudonomiae]KAE8408854.1 hypothetical protein BDV37DRAFT_278373 [Aspergillus pseudonomiae]
MATRDGFYFDNGTAALQHGLKCAGAISPPNNITGKETQPYDVIIVGAGYAGLTACRDLCIAGYNVLLLEARDRIGGRTYTAEVDGHLYEMGGTWVHWNQPHVYREMSRYDLTALLPSHVESSSPNYCATSFEGKHQNVDQMKLHAMTEKAFKMLCDVDGKSGREVLPYPHNPHHNPKAKHWEQMSVAQRLDQIKAALTGDELAALQAHLSSICGIDMDKAGLFDVLRWWALGGYTMDGLYETGDQFKIPTGQSNFARCFFEESLQSHHLKYSFNTVVTSIQDQGNRVIVNRTWSAKRVICAVPLNVLRKVAFEPALSPSKMAATRPGNINHGAKVHLEASSSALRSWSCASWPPTRVCHGSGDGLTPDGNTHIVCFGSNKDFLRPEQDAQDFAADCQKLQDMDIRKTVWHNWSKDPFSEGSWCMFQPNFSFQHLKALQQRAGNILFANSDWALGWRGFIDGAIERGGRAAKDVSSELDTFRKPAKI